MLKEDEQVRWIGGCNPATAAAPEESLPAIFVCIY
jgi:hypothetical protein